MGHAIFSGAPAHRVRMKDRQPSFYNTYYIQILGPHYIFGASYFSLYLVQILNTGKTAVYIKRIILSLDRNLN